LFKYHKVRDNQLKNYKLEEVIEFIRNGINVKQSEKMIGYPITRIETISNGVIDIERVKYSQILDADLERYRLQNGDILFSHINSTEHIGKTAIYEGIPEVLIHGINLLLLRPRQNIAFPKYLLYLLKSNNIREYFSTRCKKAVNQSSLNQQDIKSIKISLPDLNIQQKTASILEKCESAIEKRKEANRLTNEFLKSTFLKMFKETYLIKNMAEIFYIKTGKLNANAAKENGLYPFFTCSRKTFAINDFAFDQEALILSGNNATAEYSVKHYKGKFNAYQRTYILTLKDSNNSYEFFKISLENQLNILKNRSIGSNTKYLTMDIMERIQLVVPPIELQHKFADIVQKTEKLKEKQKESEKELNNLFNSLMQKSFKGELFQ